jgi:hypothetical protein
MKSSTVSPAPARMDRSVPGFTLPLLPHEDEPRLVERPLDASAGDLRKTGHAAWMLTVVILARGSGNGMPSDR